MVVGETNLQRNERLFGDKHPVAFVTGSVARVGRCVAEHLLDQGFRLAFHAHQQSNAAVQFIDRLQVAGRECMLLTGSVEEETSVSNWLEQVVERFDRVDVLVNSAAIWDPIPLEETQAADFRKFFEVNSLGTALTCQHFGLHMTRQPWGGAIVNLGDWAVRRPYRDFSAYFSSKAVVETLTQSMAVELATRNPNVRVNAVMPGPVMLADGISDARRERIIAESLLKREGSADDVAQAVLFLATSPFVTGVCLPVDGGRTIYAGPAADPVAHPHAE
ncbi:MAG: SDR family oxidoreductase [Pirellulaceae bacterium]